MVTVAGAVAQAYYRTSLFGSLGQSTQGDPGASPNTGDTLSVEVHNPDGVCDHFREISKLFDKLKKVQVSNRMHLTWLAYWWHFWSS